MMSRESEIAALAGTGSPTRRDLLTHPGGPEINPSGEPIPSHLTGAELAALLGLSVRHLQNLATNGVLVADGRNRYPARACISAYAAYLQSRRAGDALSDEKLRLTRAQADKEEARAARERGELVEAEAVSREWAGILRDLRNALLAVPSRCGAVLPHLTTTDTATLDREIRKALEGLANGNH